MMSCFGHAHIRLAGEEDYVTGNIAIEVGFLLSLQQPPVLVATTVEPLYNGHFGTSHFWVIFAVI